MSGLKMIHGLCFLLVAGLLLGFSSISCANLVVGPFDGSGTGVNEGDQLDGHDVGDTAAFIDGAVTATLTTRTIIEADGTVHSTSGSGAVMNSVANGSFGVNSGGSGDTSSRFDNNEGWGFDWSVDTEFTFIDLSAFTTNGTEAFTIQSDDWIGLGVTPGHSSVTFDNVAGSLTLVDKDASDEFDLADLSNNAALPVSAGTDILIAFVTTNATGVAYPAAFEFSTVAVPEPSAALFLSMAGLFCGVLQWRKRHL